MSLAHEIAELDEATRQRLHARGFDAGRLLSWASTIGQADERNQLKGQFEHLPSEALTELRSPDDNAHRKLKDLGRAAIARGEVASCVLAGGMATRMGGVVKALVEIDNGKTFLDHRLAEQQRVADEYGSRPPLWLMTSEATEQAIRTALGERCDNRTVATFEQFASLRLSPQGKLFRHADGTPSLYATGHGDLVDALQQSQLLNAFTANGGRYVWISNLDNLGATIDPLVLGYHIASSSTLSVEVVDKLPGDRGGGPVVLDGRPVIAEHFRLPPNFTLDEVPVFNTNTFIVSAQHLAQFSMPWTYLEVQKQVEQSTAIQFERLLGELSFSITPQWLRVPRDGKHSRFLPTKSQADLTQLQTWLQQYRT